MKTLAVLLAVLILAVTWRTPVMEIQKKREEMLYPTVTLQTERGMGTGVIFHTEEGMSLILTAKHVIQNTEQVVVTIYPDERMYRAAIFKESINSDLAVLRIKGEVPFAAVLSTNLDLQVFTEIYKVGGGGGADPYPGTGIITAVDEMLMTMDTGTVMGDSGGGLFALEEDEYRLVGIIIAVSALGGKLPVYHRGIAHNTLAIWDLMTQP